MLHSMHTTVYNNTISSLISHSPQNKASWYSPREMWALVVQESRYNPPNSRHKKHFVSHMQSAQLLPHIFKLSALIIPGRLQCLWEWRQPRRVHRAHLWSSASSHTCAYCTAASPSEWMQFAPHFALVQPRLDEHVLWTHPTWDSTFDTTGDILSPRASPQAPLGAHTPRAVQYWLVGIGVLSLNFDAVEGNNGGGRPHHWKNTKINPSKHLFSPKIINRAKTSQSTPPLQINTFHILIKQSKEIPTTYKFWGRASR